MVRFWTPLGVVFEHFFSLLFTSKNGYILTFPAIPAICALFICFYDLFAIFLKICIIIVILLFSRLLYKTYITLYAICIKTFIKYVLFCIFYARNSLKIAVFTLISTQTCYTHRITVMTCNTLYIA